MYQTKKVIRFKKIYFSQQVGTKKAILLFCGLFLFITSQDVSAQPKTSK
ncbi:MAG: hypothetical protein JWQ25_774, partial [Daejeonella sp.]|nr:hypothetical protein [Daejeonella sp.]